MRAAVLLVSLAAFACGDTGDPDPIDGAIDVDAHDAAQTIDAPQARVVNVGAEGLNMRDGPGLEYEILRVIPEGQVVDVLGGPENGTWWNVGYEGYVGWCSGDYLQFL